MTRQKRIVRILQEFSLPLIFGVFGGLFAANFAPDWYQGLFGDSHGTLPFLVNDIFMAFFFGIAAKEITEAALPGGSLNPMKKAMNPLIASLVKMLQLIDEYSAPDDPVRPEIEVLPLEFSSAEEIADTLGELLDASRRAA